MKASQFNVYETSDDLGIVANTYSGAVVLVSREAIDALQTKNAAEIDVYFNAHQKMREHLLSKAILLSDDINEQKSLQVKLDLMVNRKKHLSYSIATTLGCNFACPYCFQEREQGAMKKEVQEQTIRYIASQIDDSTTRLSVCWYGGEPTLTPHIISDMSKELIALAAKHNISYQAAIITNGYLLDKKMLQLLKDCLVKTIQITIDGSKKTHDARRYLIGGAPTYDVIIDHVKLASEMGFHIKLRVNIDKTNYKEFEEVKTLVGNLPGVSCYAEALFDAKPQEAEEKAHHFSESDDYNDFRREDENSITLSELMQRKNLCAALCATGKTIHPEGFIFDCITDISDTHKASGTVFEEASAKKGFYDAAYIWEDTACKSCSYLPVCFGGCPKHYQGAGMLKCTRTKTTLPRLLQKTLKEKSVARGKKH